MSHNRIDIGDGNIFHGNVVAAETIKDSFKFAAGAEKAELAALLKSVVSLVSDECAKLDESTQESVGRRLKGFTEEAVASKPDKGFLRQLGEGLVSSLSAGGRAVAEIAGAINNVLKLFGVPHLG